MENTGAKSFSGYNTVFQRTDGCAWWPIVMDWNLSYTVFLLSLVRNIVALSIVAVTDVVGETNISIAKPMGCIAIDPNRAIVADYCRYGLLGVYAKVAGTCVCWHFGDYSGCFITLGF